MRFTLCFQAGNALRTNDPLVEGGCDQNSCNTCRFQFHQFLRFGYSASNQEMQTGKALLCLRCQRVIRAFAASDATEIQQNHLRPTGALQMFQNFDGESWLSGQGTATEFCRSENPD